MDRLCRRKCYRALTLLELILSSVFVAILALVMFLSVRQSMTSQRKAWVTQDSQQAIHLAQGRLREELRAAQVLLPAPPDPDSDEGPAVSPMLTYQRVQMVGKRALLDPSGMPVWQGPYELFKDEQGGIVTTREDRQISNLGPEGELEFQRLSDRHLLIKITATRGTEGTNLQHSSTSATLEIVLKP